MDAVAKALADSFPGMFAGKRDLSEEEFLEITSRLELDDVWKALIGAIPGVAVALIPLLG